MLLVAMPGAPSSFLLLVAMPFVSSSISVEGAPPKVTQNLRVLLSRAAVERVREEGGAVNVPRLKLLQKIDSSEHATAAREPGGVWSSRSPAGLETWSDPKTHLE